MALLVYEILRGGQVLKLVQNFRVIRITKELLDTMYNTNVVKFGNTVDH